MEKGRLEAFSDAVIAIIMTIMVLELHPPEETTFAALLPLAPIFLSYIISFVFLGVYWNNHHHLLQAVHRVNGNVLLANMHLLFWLSLIPFATAWIGQTGFAPWPVATYGALNVACAFAYFILARVLIAADGSESMLAEALGNDRKGKLSLALWFLGMLVSFWLPLLACAFYVAVAAVWIIPDRRIEVQMKD
jgi:uncharacterized membrane protein